MNSARLLGPTALALAFGLALAADPGRAAAGPKDEPHPETVSEESSRAQAIERPRAEPAPRTRRRERLRQRVTAMRAWYLTEQLALDPVTAERLFSLLAHYDELIEDAHRRGVELRRALRRANATARPDEALLDQLVDELLAHYEDLYRVQRKRLIAVRGVVTPAQNAKLVLLLPQIDNAIRREMQRGLRGKRARRDRDLDGWFPAPSQEGRSRRPARQRHPEREPPEPPF